jgi:hypothetical protein
MRILGSAAIAVIALYLIDQALTNGRYTEAAITLTRQITRSLGF